MPKLEKILAENKQFRFQILFLSRLWPACFVPDTFVRECTRCYPCLALLIHSNTLHVFMCACFIPQILRDGPQYSRSHGQRGTEKADRKHEIPSLHGTLAAIEKHCCVSKTFHS